MNTPSSLHSSKYRNYVLVMLTIVYAFNFIDRQLLVILQESIKADLNLSDTQLGVLTGFTFAMFYVTMGIPIARLADRWNRRNVVAISLAIWSGMTAISGAVQNFFQLLLARIGVGVGEAGGSPPAHAMISDYFPAEKRGRALSIYSTGIYIGVLFGFLLGGYLNDVFGWRQSFVMIGVPGVLFAVVLYLSVKEPVRGAMDKAVDSQAGTSLRDVARLLMSKKSFIILALATGCHAFATYGLGNWIPSMLMRVHEMSSAEVGTMLGLIVGLGGATGTFLGGYLADKFAVSSSKWYLRVPAIGALIGVPFALVSLMTGNTTFVMIGLGFTYVSFGFFLAPCIAVTHNMVPPYMRAFASAILFFVLNFIGLGFGPLTVGFVSDIIEPQFGVYSLRWALLISPAMATLGAVLFLYASKFVERDLD